MLRSLPLLFQALSWQIPEFSVGFLDLPTFYSCFSGLSQLANEFSWDYTISFPSSLLPAGSSLFLLLSPS